jgi:hypothetical protein
MTKRVLIINSRGTDPIECYILEYSPSGLYVKLSNLYGNLFWMPVANVRIVEELPPDPDGRRAVAPETTP